MNYDNLKVIKRVSMIVFFVSFAILMFLSSALHKTNDKMLWFPVAIFGLVWVSSLLGYGILDYNDNMGYEVRTR